MKRAGIVIVTFNSAEAVGACLAAATRQPVDIVVVDNASTDGTVAVVRQWPQVQLIANTANRGFAAAVNQGIAALDTEFVLLLNPDVTLLSPIEPLVDACSAPGVAAAAGKLVDPDGQPQAGFAIRRLPTPAALAFEALGWNRLWPRNPVNRRYRCLDRDLDQQGPAEQPAGALLMLRRDVWRRLKGLDEEFHPLWFEDVDYAKRVRDHGYLIEYVPSVTARHTGGHSVRKLPPGCRALYWYGSLLRYTSKHFGCIDRKLICGAVVFGLLLRMLAALLAERSLTPVAVYGKALWLTGGFLISGRIRDAGKLAAAGTTS